MPICYSCLQNQEKSYRCIYSVGDDKVTVLLCANCAATYPFTNVLEDVLNKPGASLVRELPIIESIRPLIDIDRAEEEAEKYAIVAAGILIVIVLCVAAITVIAGWMA